MDKKNVYGEYTLLHWIELILRKNVVLPSYQRHFVWTEEKYNKFIGALKNGNFIPPVIIHMSESILKTKKIVSGLFGRHEDFSQGTA